MLRGATSGLLCAAVLGLTACGGLPEVASAHPEARQPANPFSMAQPRCAAQGKQPAVSLRDPMRGVRIGGHQIYRGASLTCQ